MKETKTVITKYELTEKEEKVFSDALDLALDLSRNTELPKELQGIFFDAYYNLSNFLNSLDYFKETGVVCE